MNKYINKSSFLYKLHTIIKIFIAILIIIFLSIFKMYKKCDIFVSIFLFCLILIYIYYIYLPPYNKQNIITKIIYTCGIFISLLLYRIISDTFLYFTPSKIPINKSYDKIYITNTSNKDNEITLDNFDKYIDKNKEYEIIHETINFSLFNDKNKQQFNSENKQQPHEITDDKNNTICEKMQELINTANKFKERLINQKQSDFEDFPNIPNSCKQIISELNNEKLKNEALIMHIKKINSKIKKILNKDQKKIFDKTIKCGEKTLDTFCQDCKKQKDIIFNTIKQIVKEDQNLTNDTILEKIFTNNKKMYINDKDTFNFIRKTYLYAAINKKDIVEKEIYLTIKDQSEKNKYQYKIKYKQVIYSQIFFKNYIIKNLSNALSTKATFYVSLDMLLILFIYTLKIIIIQTMIYFVFINTDIDQTVYYIEKILLIFYYFNINIINVKLVVNVVINLINNITKEYYRILDAYISRGGDCINNNDNYFKRVSKQIHTFIIIVVPLVANLFARIDMFTYSLISRHYTYYYNKTTSYSRYKYSIYDLITAIIATIIFIIILLMHYVI